MDSKQDMVMDLRQASLDVIRAGQAPNGAYVASPTFSQYGYSWLRDGAWIAHAMAVTGHHDSAEAFHQWAADTLLRYTTHVEALLAKIANGETLAETDYLPTRFSLDGALGQEDWPDYGYWCSTAARLIQNYGPRCARQSRCWYAIWRRYGNRQITTAGRNSAIISTPRLLPRCMAACPPSKRMTRN